MPRVVQVLKRKMKLIIRLYNKVLFAGRTKKKHIYYWIFGPIEGEGNREGTRLPYNLEGFVCGWLLPTLFLANGLAIDMEIAHNINGLALEVEIAHNINGLQQCPG